MLTRAAGVHRAASATASDERGKFDFRQWGEKGLPAVEPLWLLKYLPNLPASHIAIFNDLHGPNNSLTMREASSNLAIAEAYYTIVRGHADAMLAGADRHQGPPGPDDSRRHAGRDRHRRRRAQPASAGRSTSTARGAVMGEGAAAIMLEELASAQARGAKILGEVIGFGSSAVSRPPRHRPIPRGVHATCSRMALRSAGIEPDDVGHIHAHGLSTRRCDAEEAQAIAEVFAEPPNRPCPSSRPRAISATSARPAAWSS